MYIRKVHNLDNLIFYASNEVEGPSVKSRKQAVVIVNSIWPLRIGKLRDWPPGAAFNNNLHQEGVAKFFFSLHKKCHFSLSPLCVIHVFMMYTLQAFKKMFSDIPTFSFLYNFAELVKNL